MDYLIQERSIIAPVVNKWFLISSPAALALIFTIYLMFVLKIGPRFMSTRKPFDLTNFTRIYNLAQVFICSYYVNWLIEISFTFSKTWQCLPDETDKEKLLKSKNMQWWFLVLRLVELIETVVFVARKKPNQVSVLHIYHHISTATLVWISIKYFNSEILVILLRTFH